MGLQGAGQAVGRRPRQPGPRRQGRQADRPLGYRIQYGDSLVQHADSARLAHVLILPSHMVRRQRWRLTMWDGSISTWASLAESACWTRLSPYWMRYPRGRSAWRP